MAQDKLFATLDPTMRGLTLSDKREVTLVDTVGFIRKLPHHLIEAFKSTLEETLYADCLLIVADGADSEVDTHLKVVNNLLSDLGAGDKPKLIVFNKTDALDSPRNFAHLAGDIPFVEISAKEGNDIDALLQKIEDIVPGKKKEVTLLIPFSSGQILSEIHSTQTVLTEDYLAEGTLVRCLLDAASYAKYREFLTED